MNASQIVAIAREMLGKPYAEQGRGPAVDCAGVPVYVARRLGLAVTDVLGYGRMPMPAEMRAALDAHLDRVPKESIQIGDVVWMRFIDDRSRARGLERPPQHLGIVADYALGGLSLIHAYNGAGLKKVVEHRLDAQWRERIVAVWRYPGVVA